MAGKVGKLSFNSLENHSKTSEYNTHSLNVQRIIYKDHQAYFILCFLTPKIKGPFFLNCIDFLRVLCNPIL